MIRASPQRLPIYSLKATLRLNPPIRNAIKVSSLLGSLQCQQRHHISTESQVSTENVSAWATQTALSSADNIMAAHQLLPTAAMKIGDFKAMGLCNLTPAGVVEQMLEYVNVYSGLPWWGTILVTTAALRFVMLPLVLKAQRNNAILFNMQPELKAITDRMAFLKEKGDLPAAQKESLKVLSLYKERGANPLKGFQLPLVQGPVMFSFFYALRDMSTLPVPSLHSGGALWFTDLAVPDPLYALPVLTAASFMVMIECGTEAGLQSEQTKLMKNVFRVMGIGMIPVTAYFPASVLVYWLSSNIISIIQVVLFKNKSVRAALNIPQLKPAEPIPDQGAYRGRRSSPTKAKPLSFMDGFKIASKSHQQQ